MASLLSFRGAVPTMRLGMSLRPVVSTVVRAYSSEPLKKTSLHDFHQKLGGKMVPFCGWSMPVQYTDGVLQSHQWVRNSAGLFDVSHMAQLKFTGADRVKFFETLTPGDIGGLKEGNSRLSVYTNEKGGIKDDTMITKQKDHLYVVVNAGCADKDIAHFKDMMGKLKMDVKMEVLNRSLLALQGPKAAEVVKSLTNEDLTKFAFMSGKNMKIANIDCYVTRCGYTGEDGFEISVPNDKAVQLADTLLKNAAVKPIGLGARDSLRLEAGLCLYGNDIEEHTTPIEGGLTWLIGAKRRTGGFLGDKIILQQLKDGATKRRVGLLIEGAPARSHAKVFDESGKKEIGEVTSGGPAPSLNNKPIAMAYVPWNMKKDGTKVMVEVRGKKYPAVVAKTPFVPNRYYRVPA